jgi:hypothetical protein
MTLTGKTLRLTIVGIAMASLLVLGVVQRQITFAHAREVLMVSEAVDPRALLMGHYAILNLQPQSFETAAMQKPPFTDGEPVFVHLTPEAEKGRWRVVGLSKSRPKIAANDLTLRAKVAYVDGDGARATIHFAYGPDRIYLNQQEAMAVEEATRRLWVDPETQPRAPQPIVYAILAVSDDGTASIKGVELGGERFESSW